MKYCLIDKIGNVKNTVPYKEGVLYSTKEDSIFFEGIEILKDIDGSSIYKISDSLIQIWDKESGCYYFNGNIFRSEYFAHISNKTKKIIAATKPKRISRGIYKRDIFFLHEDLVRVNELILENIEGSIVTYTDNILLLANKFIVNAYALPSGQPLWQFDLTILGEYPVLFSTEKKRFEVSKFLGTWQNELIVACEGGLVLSLNIETGKPFRHWDKLPASADSDIKDVFRGNLHQSGHVYQLNLAANKVVAIYYRHIVEIDLYSGEIITKNLSESLSKHFISEFQLKSGYAEDDTHYYTTVHFDKTLLKLNYLPTAVCAINKETLEIDWFHRFDDDGKGDFVSIQVPQVSNGKLYQLTANKVLHIFEKEP